MRRSEAAVHLVRAHKYADGRIGVEMHNLPQPIATGRSSRAHVRTRKAATYRMRRGGHLAAECADALDDRRCDAISASEVNAQSSKRNSEQPSACMRASAYACVHACVRICVYMHTRICVFMRWHTVHAFQRGHDRIHRNCRMPLGSAEHRRKPLRGVKKAEASRANHTCRSPHELVVHRGTCDDADQRTSSQAA